MESLNSPHLDESAFLHFTSNLLDDRRWELIDGEAIRRAVQPVRHQLIAQSFERLLCKSLDRHSVKLDGLLAAGLRHPTDAYFRPIVDVAVIDGDEWRIRGSDFYFDHCFLAAEVVSAESAAMDEYRKLPRYRAFPDCNHVIAIDVDRVRLRLWSRQSDWAETIYADLGDRIELPEFGFACTVRDLYARTDLA